MKHLNVKWIQNHYIVFYNGHTTPKATIKSLMTEKKRKKEGSSIRNINMYY